MVLINKAINEVTVKVVYYGPGLCGKTTNLEKIYGNPKVENKGKMISMSTETDRTLFFDFLPMELGTIGGQKVRVQLYTVPGQVFYDATRKLVLRGADGVVFVADSQESMRGSNIDSLENLKTNLRINRIDPDKVAVVYQYNKRDLPNIDSVATMNEYMNPGRVPTVEAAAIQGTGVTQTLRAVVARILENLKANVDTTLYEVAPLSSPDMSARSGVTLGSAGTPKLSMRTEAGGMPLPRTSTANAIPTPAPPSQTRPSSDVAPQRPAESHPVESRPVEPSPFFRNDSATTTAEPSRSGANAFASAPFDSSPNRSFSPSESTAFALSDADADATPAAFAPAFENDRHFDAVIEPDFEDVPGATERYDAAEVAEPAFDESAIFAAPDLAPLPDVAPDGEESFAAGATAAPFGGPETQEADLRISSSLEDAFIDEPSAYDTSSSFADSSPSSRGSNAMAAPSFASRSVDASSPFDTAFETSEPRWGGDASSDAAEADPFATDSAHETPALDESHHDSPFGYVSEPEQEVSAATDSPFAGGETANGANRADVTTRGGEHVPSNGIARDELTEMLTATRAVVESLETALSRAREQQQIIERRLTALN